MHGETVKHVRGNNTPTYAQISSVNFVLKLLRHVSVLIHHLQGVYSCVS